MRLRSHIVAAAALAAIPVLAACSAPSPSAGGAGSKTLKVGWVANEKAGIEAVVTAFKEANPDIEVVLTTAETTQYQAALRTELSAGTAADVVWVWPADGNAGAIRQLKGGGFLADLSNRPWAQEYPPYIKELASVDGKVNVMAPIATSFTPTYNQATLDAAGVKAPSRWSEVIPFCKTAASMGKVAYALPGQNPYGAQPVLYNLAPDLVYGGGATFDADLVAGKTTFTDNKGYTDAVAKFKQMSDEGCFQPQPTGTPYDETNRMVAQGEAFGSFFIGTRLAALQAVAPNGDFRLYEFHSDDDPSTDAMTVSTQGGAAINAKSSNQELATKFVDFLAANVGVYKDAQPGTVPTIAKNYAPKNSNEQLLVTAMSGGRAVQFLNQLWPNARMEEAMNKGLQGILAGANTPAEMLSSMQAEVKTK